MKRSPKPGDMNQRMYAVVQQAAGLDDSPVKDPKAVERGRLGGLARAKALPPERRKAIGRQARAARPERPTVASKRAAAKPGRPVHKAARPAQ